MCECALQTAADDRRKFEGHVQGRQLRQDGCADWVRVILISATVSTRRTPVERFREGVHLEVSYTTNNELNNGIS